MPPLQSITPAALGARRAKQTTQGPAGVLQAPQEHPQLCSHRQLLFSLARNRAANAA